MRVCIRVHVFVWSCVYVCMCMQACVCVRAYTSKNGVSVSMCDYQSVVVHTRKRAHRYIAVGQSSGGESSEGAPIFYPLRMSKDRERKHYKT